MNVFQKINHFLLGTEYILLINNTYSYSLPVEYADDEAFVRVVGSRHTTLLPGGETSDYHRWKPLTSKAGVYFAQT